MQDYDDTVSLELDSEAYPELEDAPEPLDHWSTEDFDDLLPAHCEV